jgi:hypothetical protein
LVRSIIQVFPAASIRNNIVTVETEMDVDATTVMLTAAEVVLSPALSVALAVSEYVPAATLFQVRV